MAHMLFVCGAAALHAAAEVARAPEGLERQPGSPHPRYPSREDVLEHEAACNQILQQAYESSKPAKRMLKMPGKGCGFCYEHSPYCSYATRNGVHVAMTGEVSSWPGVDAVSATHNAFVRNEAPPEEDDAHWLLDFYSTFTDPDLEQEEGVAGSDVMDKALQCLASLTGSFAFVIYDSNRHRVLAARDREGVCPLYWGATDNGQLLIGTQSSDLDCNPSATLFPAGCLFTSERNMIAYSPGERGWLIAGDDVPGELLSFVAAEDAAHFRGVKAIPRITSKGMVCGAVYKVSSMADMSKPLVNH